MTYSKTLIAGVAIAAFSFSPALADGHKEKKNAQHMDGTHSEKTMESKTMTPEITSETKTEMGMQMGTETSSKMTGPASTMGVKTKEKKSMTVDEIKESYMGTLKPDTTIGTVLQEGTVATKPSDKDMMMYDGELKMKSKIKAMDSDSSVKNNTIVVPSSSDSLTTVTCPAGTTAQADMTCMVTGDYKTE